jgi:hypothetical protein
VIPAATVEYLRSACEADPRWAPHLQRYLDSLDFVASTYTGGSIVDVGGESPFYHALTQIYGSDLVSLTGPDDLRECWCLPNCTPYSVSYITCLEVIEHLKDLPHSDREVWTGEALLSALRAIRVALVPGGQLFLSTPNAASWIILKNWLVSDPPLMWKFHPRELAPSEVTYFLNEAGFRVDRLESKAVWNRHGFDITPYLQFDNGLREDCLFVLAHTP